MSAQLRTPRALWRAMLHRPQGDSQRSLEPLVRHDNVSNDNALYASATVYLPLRVVCHPYVVAQFLDVGDARHEYVRHIAKFDHADIFGAGLVVHCVSPGGLFRLFFFCKGEGYDDQRIVYQSHCEPPQLAEHLMVNEPSIAGLSSIRSPYRKGLVSRACSRAMMKSERCNVLASGAFSFSSFQSAADQGGRRAMLCAAGYVPAAGCTPERRPLFPREVRSSLASRFTARARLCAGPGLLFPLVHPDATVRQNPRQSIRQQFHIAPSCIPKEAREVRHELPQLRQTASTPGVCRHG